jgi:hypothetical protein
LDQEIDVDLGVESGFNCARSAEDRVSLIGIALCLLSLTSSAMADESRSALVAELRSRLTQSDVATVNAYLSNHWETRMAPLNLLVQRCDSEALKLSVRLLDTSNLEALQAHKYSLELATGRCPAKVIPMIRPDQAKLLCGIDAFAETSPSADLGREIDRRVGQLRKQRGLSESPSGVTCLDRYAELRRAIE